MRVSTIAGILVVGSLAIQAAIASSAPSPAGAPSVRDENRQIIIAEYGVGYDPNASTRVVYGFPGALVDAVVPLAQAIEIRLDTLDRNNVRLATLAASQTSASEEPEWPLEGAVWFHEYGWKEKGARCPTVHARAGGPGTPLDLAVEALTGAGLVSGDPRLGSFTTSVSTFPTSRFGQVVTSSLQWYEDPLGRASGAQPRTYDYPFAGWVLAAGTEEEPDYMEIDCTEPTASSGQVTQEAFVMLKVDRVG